MYVGPVVYRGPHTLRSFPRKRESSKIGEAKCKRPLLCWVPASAGTSGEERVPLVTASDIADGFKSQTATAHCPRDAIGIRRWGEGRRRADRRRAVPVCRAAFTAQPPLGAPPRMGLRRPGLRLAAFLCAAQAGPLDPRAAFACLRNLAQAVQRAPRARVVVPVERSPEAPRWSACEADQQAPHLAPLTRRLARAPLGERGGTAICFYS